MIETLIVLNGSSLDGVDLYVSITIQAVNFVDVVRSLSTLFSGLFTTIYTDVYVSVISTCIYF